VNGECGYASREGQRDLSLQAANRPDQAVETAQNANH
jgi:hypothetical protein